MGATIHVRGEGGALWEMDLPLGKDHALKLADGRLVRVNPDGSPFTEAEPAPPVEPAPAPAPDEPDDDEDDEAEDPDVVAAAAPPKPAARAKPKP